MLRRRVWFQRFAGSRGFRAAIPVANFEMRAGRMPCCHRCLSSGPAAAPDLVSSTTAPARTHGWPSRPCQVTSESMVARLPDSGRKSVVLPVPGLDYGAECSLGNTANGRRKRLVDVIQALRRQAGTVRRFVGDAFLDGGFAGTFGFDLQEAGCAVHVGPGADLVPATAAACGQQVAVQLRGVEVDGVVGEGPYAVHLQDAGPAGEGRQGPPRRHRASSRTTSAT